jgi:hypothetical protein
MILKLKDILPNPFRDLKSNPLIEDKVEELVGSINLTGFWDNVVVRKNADGKYELAYGHHRLAAALRAGLLEADFIVKTLDDATMIQIMDNENRETYGSTPLSLIESVKAVVASLAKGTIKPFVIDPKTRKDTIFYAPSFVPGDDDPNRINMAYTAKNVAQFLGRTKTCGGYDKPTPEIQAALNALQLIEKGRFSSSLLTTKDKTGAKVSITTSELLRITSDIKRDVACTEERTEEVKKANEADAMRMRELQAQVKAREDAAEAVRQVELDKLKAAREAEDKKESDRLFLKMKAQGEAQIAKNLADKGKLEAIELRVAERKRKEEEARNEDAYAPIRRDVERALFKMDSVSTGSFCEDVKSLAKRKLSLKDRQRLWESASALADWYGGWVCSQFVVAPDQLQPKRGTISKRRTK